MNDAEIIGRELAQVQTGSEVEAMIRIALDKGLNPTELYAILREERAQRAEQAFNAAFAKFKAECPPIRKRSENVQFQVTRDGVRRASRYAALEDIDADTKPSLTANGLSYAWGDAVVNGETITMSCTVSHIGGHKRSSSVTMPHESKAGASPQQKYASTISYLQRYSLIAALGLTTCDDDLDGEHSGGETITEAQVEALNNLLIEIDDALRAEKKLPIDREKFLKFLNVSKLADLPLRDWDKAVNALNAKRKAQP